MQLSYDYYRIFYYVAKCGSFTGAARALLNNQPNITRAIRNLEAALGCVLFLRSRKGITLTPEGERLYAHIRVAFEHIEAGEEEVSRDRALQGGILSIGVSEVALHCLLLPVLKKYRSLYSGVRIHIMNHTTTQALSELQNGLVELAAVTTPTDKSPLLAEKRVRTIQEVAVCSPVFKDLIGRPVSLKEIAQYPIISLNAQTKTHELYSGYFSAHGLTFSPDIVATTADQILPIVECDLGIGFVPEEFAAKSDYVKVLNVREKLPERNICLVKRRDRPLSMAAKALETLILEKIPNA